MQQKAANDSCISSKEMPQKLEATHPVAGYDLATVVHQGAGVQLLSCLVEANAVPHVYR